MGESVLVYHHHKDGRPVVAKGLATISQTQLDKILIERPDLQATSKRIARVPRAVDIFQHDLYTDSQKDEFKSKPNYDTNVGTVTLPLGWVLRSVIKATGTELVILSAKR